MKVNIKYKLILLMLASSFLFFAAFGVNAAVLYFVEPQEAIYESDIFSVEVRVDSVVEAINAVQADVIFSSDFFEVISADNTNSILNLWPRVPSFDNETGKVLFSGGSPDPGFQGSSGLIGTITLEAKNTGQTSLNFSDTSRVLLNDGLGTEASLEAQSIALNILAPPEGYQPKEVDIISDTIPPDAFIPIVSHSKYIYDGKYFVAFETQDHESGISHYEVQERIGDVWGDWQVAVSPYMLQNQEGDITVFVRAVDKAGNERIGGVEINISKKRFYLIYIVLTIVLLIIFMVIWRHQISRSVIVNYQKAKVWRRK